MNATVHATLMGLLAQRHRYLGKVLGLSSIFARDESDDHLFRLLMTKDPSVRVSKSLETLFPAEWLEAKAEGDPRGRTNREIQTEVSPRFLCIFRDRLVNRIFQNFLRRYHAARPQQFIGVVSQMAAGLTHRVSEDRLREISKLIPKVVIMTGDEDHLVDPQRSRFIKENMPEAELVEFSGTGHGILMQRTKEANEIVARAIREGRSRS